MKTIYFNGTVITMNGKICDAILIEGDVILEVGEYADIIERNNDAATTDLRGRVIIPGFIDAHSHFVQYAGSLRHANLSSARSFEDIVRILRDFKDKGNLQDDEWIVAYGYDHNNLIEQEHPNREVLDQVSMTNPILIAHASGHMGAINSIMLDKYEITRNTPNPNGGIIGKDDEGLPTGYLEEIAFMKFADEMPKLDDKKWFELLKKAQDIYFSYGITTAQDGLSKSLEFDLMSEAHLDIDVISYIDIKNASEVLENHPQYVGKYINNYKIGGYKVFLDGSPQGRTAWLSEPYEGEIEYCGYPIYQDEEVRAFIQKADREKVQLLIHGNGDRAIDQLLNCHDGFSQYRNVIIHSQITRLDQLPLMKALGLIPSFFVAHTYYWGDVHIKNLGYERASIICPAGSALKSDLMFTFHQDSPVIEPNMLDTLQCSMDRITRDGVQLSIDEAVGAYDALKAVTINGAYQYFEENTKGTLEAGKLADMVVLSGNPLEISPRSIEVIATIKSGEVVYIDSKYK